jgi:hypothetical protein
MTFDSKRLLLYGLLPMSVGVAMLALYFSETGWMQTLASPADARELGLIENIQNLLLVVALVSCVRSARREELPRWRGAWRFIAGISLLVLMEELDWGLQHYTALSGGSPNDVEPFNLHTQGGFSRYFKRGMDWAMVPVFLILPLYRARVSPKLRQLVPDAHSILLLVIAFFVSLAAHNLEDAGWPNNGSLHLNISEFRETFTYWLGLLYLWELALRRRGVG